MITAGLVIPETAARVHTTLVLFKLAVAAYVKLLPEQISGANNELVNAGKAEKVNVIGLELFPLATTDKE